MSGIKRVSVSSEQLPGLAKYMEEALNMEHENVPHAALPHADIRSVKIAPRDGKKPGHADVTFRVSLGMDWERALPLLNELQTVGMQVSLLVCKIQLGFGDSAPNGHDPEDEEDES